MDVKKQVLAMLRRRADVSGLFSCAVKSWWRRDDSGQFLALYLFCLPPGGARLRNGCERSSVHIRPRSIATVPSTTQ
jgi:hypothetical protein